MNTIIRFCRQTGRDVVLRLGGFLAKPSDGVHIITGHMSHRKNPSPIYMEQLMNKLSKTVRFIRIEDAVAMIKNNEVPNEPLCAFTFDDGFEECYDCIAPVLEKYGTNAIFFVNPSFVEGDDEYIRHFTEDTVHTKGKRPMRWEQLRELQERGFIIGAHTMDHYLTAKDDENELRYQIIECKNVIEEKLGESCEYFAWPSGTFEHTSLKAVEMACNTYQNVFSQTDSRHYFSFDGKVINRRHFEPFWPFSHIMFFLSKTISDDGENRPTVQEMSDPKRHQRPLPPEFWVYAWRQ